MPTVILHEKEVLERSCNLRTLCDLTVLPFQLTVLLDKQCFTCRYKAPSIIFIDEIDALCSQRGSDSEHEASRRFKAELLTQMDGLSSTKEPAGSSGRTVMVLAATNHPWLIDEAFRRRFEKRVYIPPPDAAARRSLLELNLRGTSLDADADLDAVAEELEGYSGADVTALCRDAALMSMRRAIRDKPLEEVKRLRPEEVDKPITGEDFMEATARVRRTNGDEDGGDGGRRYEEWIEKIILTEKRERKSREGRRARARLLRFF